MSQEETDQLREHSSEAATSRLDQQRLQRIQQFGTAPPDEATRHLLSLDKEWDAERRLEATAASLMLTSLALSVLHSKRWLLLSATVPAFLLQHAVQGWCPPIEVYRRMGVRSRNEIDAERTAIKALRGDFTGVAEDAASPGAAETALTAAGTR